MQINRGLLFWGLALVIGGATALAVQLDYVDRNVLADAWRLWPVVLIAVGVAIILGRTQFAWLGVVGAALVVGIAGGALLSVGPGSFTCGQTDPTRLIDHDGRFAGTSAEVHLDLNCGTLELEMGAGSEWQASVGSTDEDNPPEVLSSSSSLTVRSADRPFVGSGRERWEISLGSELTYDLDASPNAARVIMDLTDATFSRLDLDPNAGDVSLTLDGARVDDLDLSGNAATFDVSVDGESAVSGRLSGNAASHELCATSDAALRITVDDSVAFSHNLDDSDLARSGDTWTSDGYDSADNQVDLRVGGNAASFTLNPQGGCG